MLVLNLVALAFVLLHAVTWFNLAPKALVVRMQGQRVPPRVGRGRTLRAWAWSPRSWPGSSWWWCS